MAIWHLRSKVVSRSKGQSVVASAAYRAGEQLHDERYGQTHDYTRKVVSHREIMLPEGAPDRLLDRATLWNEVEAGERRKDAQLAREIEVALPRELTTEQRLELVRQFIGEQFVSRGMIADFAIHAPRASDGSEAPHAHILLTMREVGPQGFGRKQTEWNSRTLFESWREAWETTVNTRLAELGHEARIDRRSYRERGLDMEPSLHEGASYSQRRRMRQADPQALGPQTRRTIENEARKNRNRQKIAADPAHILADLTHYASTFTKEDVERAVKRFTGDQDEVLVAAVFGVAGVRRLGLDLDGHERFSTEAVIQDERQILAIADRLAELRQPATRVIDPVTIRAEMSGAGLSAEQADAVVHLTRPERIALVSGVAGAGKTTMLRTAVAAWEGAGFQVQGVALAAQAAKVLRDDTGIPSGTVARLLKRLDEGEECLGRSSVVVLDEGAMLHSQDMASLLRHVESAGAKIVMVGDAEQIQAVQAGAPFRALEARLGAVRMKDSRRQKDQGDRAATVNMGAGKTRLGLDHYRAKGSVTASETRSDMLAEIVRGYLADALVRGHDRTLLLAHRRKDVRELNDLVRQALLKSGEVKEGHQYTVTEMVSDRTVAGQTRMRTAQREFGVGDRVLFRQNSKALGVENGSVGTVVATYDGALDVRMGQDIKRVNLAEYSQLDHAYARTLHKGQGATAERVHGVFSGSMDRNLAYVLLTRHRESVRAYWNTEEDISWERLAERLVRSGGKDMASDYAVARRIAAEQFDQESEAARDQARRTRLGAFLHAAKSAVGADRAQQARDAAAQRAREDAERQAEQERQRVLRAEQERQARARELADLRAEVPSHLTAVASLVAGEKSEPFVLRCLREAQISPSNYVTAFLHLVQDMGRLETSSQYDGLRYLARRAIENAPKEGFDVLQGVANRIVAVRRRMNGYDYEHRREMRWQDSPNSLLSELWYAVRDHNRMNRDQAINLDRLEGEAAQHWQGEKVKQAERSRNTSRGHDNSPGF
ncbi:Ti-type conjugative transfer relaxase TraA [Acetobacter garciniae]|uniref:Ti-type conjugative transfer relaxase TraA n=1 Tax=Acetobacter garciniae TaxID=2817435 RepID=UPI002ED8A415